VNLTFIRLLDVEEFGGSGVLGAFVVLLIGVENDGQGSVAFSYLVLGSGAGQIEHGTARRSATDATGTRWTD
jgi:hypothetical protein